jgi:transketolase N-terminal domain/subunit
MDSIVIVKQARLNALEMLHNTGSSHIGSNFPVVDTLAGTIRLATAVLYNILLTKGTKI